MRCAPSFTSLPLSPLPSRCSWPGHLCGRTGQRSYSDHDCCPALSPHSAESTQLHLRPPPPQQRTAAQVERSSPRTSSRSSRSSSGRVLAPGHVGGDRRRDLCARQRPRRGRGPTASPVAVPSSTYDYDATPSSHDPVRQRAHRRNERATAHRELVVVIDAFVAPLPRRKGTTGASTASQQPVVAAEASRAHPGDVAASSAAEGRKPTSTYFRGDQAEELTRRAWSNGVPVPGRTGVRDFDLGFPVGRGPGWG